MIIKQIWLLTGDSIKDNLNSNNIVPTPSLLESQINLGDESGKLIEETKSSKQKEK